MYGEMPEPLAVRCLFLLLKGSKLDTRKENTMLDWIVVWLVVFAGVYILQFMVIFFKEDDHSDKK